MEIDLKFSPRPQQTEMLEFVKSSIGSGTKFMMIDAPTGVGKSYAAVMIAEWYRNEFSKKAKIDILTNTKLLQEQYTKDFPFMANLKGKSNYFCRRQNMNCGEAAVLNQASKTSCQPCPYKIAQGKFLRNPLSLTNFHLITAYSMYSPDMLFERKSKLLIIDEAHSFEETFCDFISSVYSERSIKALDIWRDWMEKDLSDISSLNELSEYTSSIIIPLLEQKTEELIEEAKETRVKKKKIEIWTTE
jgi:Rad3-related DNA helicase